VRLLVVDDKEGFREQLRHVFTDEGYEVITVASGEGAIAALGSFSPDIVIADVVLPSGDGFSMLEHARERGLHCPIIVITAYGSQESAVQALRLGAYDFVTKPFDLDVILAAVRRAAEYCRLQQAVIEGQEKLAALAIARARWHSQTEAQLADVRRAQQEISALQDLTAAIQSSLALPEVLNRIAEGVVQGLGYRAAMVAVYDPRRDALIVKSAALDREVWAQGETLAGMSLIDAFLTMDHEENLAICSARRGEIAITHHLADLFRPAVDEETARMLQQMAGVRTLATVPLMADCRLVGNFYAGSSRDALGEADIVSLQAFARQAALAIEHARLFELEQRRHRIANTLAEVSRVINSTLELKEVLNLVLKGLEGAVEYDCSAMLLLEEDNLRVRAVRGVLTAEALEVNVPADEDSLARSVLDARRPIVVADVQRHPGWCGPSYAGRVQQWIGAPLIARDEVIGLLMVGSAQAGVYGEEEAQLVMAFARQAAAAIANARLYADTEQNWREQRYLQEIAHVFNSTLDLEQVLTLVMAKTNELLGVEAGSVALLSEDGQELVFHASVGGDADVVKGFRMPASEGIVGWVVAHGESLLVLDVARDPRHYVEVDTRSGFKTRSILCVPLIAKGTVIGAIEVLNKIGHPFDADDLRMTEALTLSAATAIENAKLFQREKQTLEKLRRAQDELVRAQRLAALGQIGVTVRHEVNNPLTVVLGNADWLLQELTDLDGELLRALEAIRANALRIRDILKKLEDIKTDRVTEYVGGIKMIDIHAQDAETQQGEDVS